MDGRMDGWRESKNKREIGRKRRRRPVGCAMEVFTYCRSRPSKESSTLHATNGAAAALAGREWI